MPTWESLIRPPVPRYPGKTEAEQAALLRPTGDAGRDGVVAARVNLGYAPVNTEAADVR